jgi:hypothetical protein
MQPSKLKVHAVATATRPRSTPDSTSIRESLDDLRILSEARARIAQHVVLYV